MDAIVLENEVLNDSAAWLPGDSWCVLLVHMLFVSSHNFVVAFVPL